MFKYKVDGKTYQADDKYLDLFREYDGIETVRDLKDGRLTLAEFRMMFRILHTLAQYGKALTSSLGVAEWFKRNNCKVYPDENYVNFIIKLKENTNAKKRRKNK